VLANKGDDFSVMGMHFKLGLYEHQSAGAIQAVINMLKQEGSALLAGGADSIEKIRITAYEPAFGIIGDPAKRNPKTRQSADHSMVYIISTLIRKAFDKADAINNSKDFEDLWKALMLTPKDYGKDAIFNETTRKIMEKIEFTHGGVEYDSKYPEGIPTSMELKTSAGKVLDSGLVMFPGGHARCENISAKQVLQHKFVLLGKLGLEKHELQRFMINLANIGEMTNEDLQDIYDCNIKFAEEPIDDLTH
jgi:2-methylcitrate dehydratase